jgi:hypothetical protein
MPAKSMKTTTTSSKKPYCKVCHDAGKDEKIYTSHYVRSDPSPNGKIICPTLLAILCTYCFKQGHTSSYCPEVAKKKKELSKETAKKDYLSKEKEKSETYSSSNQKNMFDCLLEEDAKSKSKPNKKVVVEQFPALTSSLSMKKKAPETSTANVTTVSYAVIAKSGHEIAVKKEVLAEIQTIKIMETIKEKKPKIILAKKEVKTNWADYTSSDDEDEEELMTAEEYFKEYIEELPQNDAW